ncbi:hypothetical protein C4556_00135 [Candidatus Parcubacteria bacterium]|nr:MAG: hypothetical protein C4556_00135 [Candidatus Parcubacteria bacterium]
MVEQTNFHFFLGRNDALFNGIRASEVPDPYGNRAGVVPSLVVGPQLRAKNEKPVKWARIIPPGLEDFPKFAADGTRGEKIVSGSIIQVEEGDLKKSFIVSHRDEQAYYVLVRTGLMAVNGSTANDRLEIQKHGELVTHGSYSFDNASVRVAMAENEAELRHALTDPTFSMGKVEAERLGAKAVGRNIPLLGCPASSYVLWKMPIGAVLLIREVNGKLTRLVAQRDVLRRVDAKNYGSFFDRLEDNYKKLRSDLRAAKPAEASSTPQHAV